MDYKTPKTKTESERNTGTAFTLSGFAYFRIIFSYRPDNPDFVIGFHIREVDYFVLPRGEQ
jgi:hypothetical protein